MSLGWSTDGKYLATGGADEQVRVYENSDLIYTGPSEDLEIGAIFCIDWSAAEGTSTFIYSTSSGKVIQTFPLQ
jgi:WD40 repeat protein